MCGSGGMGVDVVLEHITNPVTLSILHFDIESLTEHETQLFG